MQLSSISDIKLSTNKWLLKLHWPTTHVTARQFLLEIPRNHQLLKTHEQRKQHTPNEFSNILNTSATLDGSFLFAELAVRFWFFEEKKSSGSRILFVANFNFYFCFLAHPVDSLKIHMLVRSLVVKKTLFFIFLRNRFVETIKSNVD